MSDKILRASLIRLAHSHPEFRKDILPLLGGKSATHYDREDLDRVAGILRFQKPPSGPQPGESEEDYYSRHTVNSPPYKAVPPTKEQEEAAAHKKMHEQSRKDQADMRSRLTPKPYRPRINMPNPPTPKEQRGQQHEQNRQDAAKRRFDTYKNKHPETEKSVSDFLKAASERVANRWHSL